MKLVAKEYVAAQDPEDPGVLILSRFAGAAEQMTEALLVNPLNHEELTRALWAALHMPLGERQARWETLNVVVRDRDVLGWADVFIADLKGSTRPAPPNIRVMVTAAPLTPPAGP